MSFYLQITKMTSVVDWFLEHQDEARAYRVTKIKIPRLGFTMYKDSIQKDDAVRKIHMASEELFKGDLEQYRVREPFVGVDLILVHGEMRFESVVKAIKTLRKMDRRPLRMTLDMSMGVGHYPEEWLKHAVEGLYTFCKRCHHSLAN